MSDKKLFGNPEQLDDTISRRAAIDEIKALYEWHDMPTEERMIQHFKVLPSAQQERKKGKWIYNSPVTMKCNQCGFVIKDWDWHRFKYCPNCIADMRGESDG